jgi:hypothetical protein
MMQRNNFSPGNTGIAVYRDILYQKGETKWKKTNQSAAAQIDLPTFGVD